MDPNLEEQFITLLDQYERRIYNMVYHRVGNHEDAQDLTQEIFLAVYKGLPKFRGEASPYTWIYRIALNKINRFLRKKRLMRFLSLEELRPEEENWVVENPHEDPLAPLKRAVLRKVRNLPKPFREALMLHYFDGLSYEEVAEVLGVSVGTVKSRLNRARKILAQELSGMVTPWNTGKPERFSKG